MKKISNSELGRLSVDEFRKSERIPVVIVLDNIRSLHNIGSVFRTADAFACQSLYLCGITGVPPHREIEKTALGATNTVEWKYFPTASEAVAELKMKGFSIGLVEQTDASISLEKLSLHLDKPCALIFGHEMFGVSDELLPVADFAVEIPQSGTKHSLNVSVCAGIVLWECYKCLKK